MGIKRGLTTPAVSGSQNPKQPLATLMAAKRKNRRPLGRLLTKVGVILVMQKLIGSQSQLGPIACWGWERGRT